MGNAVPEDLSRELAYYADADDVLPFGVVLERVLHSWTLQGGYPVVNVTRDKAGKSVTLAQVRLKDAHLLVLLSNSLTAIFVVRRIAIV